MNTTCQIKANRKNAIKSTGPRSVEGKNQSSKNSLKHGLLSKRLIIHDEKEKDFNYLKEQLHQNLLPEGALEELLVEKVAVSIWRLRRLINVETSAFTEKSWNETPKELHEKFYNDIMLSISRYETALEKSLYKALHELQRIQGMRMGQAVMAPIAIDLHSED